MIDLAWGISIFDRVLGLGRHLFGQYRKNPSLYLEGKLTSGLELAYRIIALFEAHDVSRTQIYRLLGKEFPDIKPSLNAEALQPLISAELIAHVAGLFGVRKAWLEGEAGRIYEPLCHYKNISAYVDFIGKLKDRNPDDLCFLTALKPAHTVDDLYLDGPDIALFFSEPIAEIDDKTIYRYHPMYGPLPWDHSPALYHLCAFFNIAYEGRILPLKGYSVPQKHLAKVAAGEAIPMHHVKISGIWHPEDYAYPAGSYNGRVELGDWQGVMDYFKNSSVMIQLRKDGVRQFSQEVFDDACDRS